MQKYIGLLNRRGFAFAYSVRWRRSFLPRAIENFSRVPGFVAPSMSSPNVFLNEKFKRNNIN